MQKKNIDINADLGEGMGQDAMIIPYISSCNIACGGHAGNYETMTKVVKLAKLHGVKIGAHPSFPDQVNFGRVKVDMSCAALFTSIEEQINSLETVLAEQHATLHHIKPHGALYNLAATDIKVANVIVEVLNSMELPVKLYVPFGSIIASVALKHDIPIIYEAFADRNYNDDLTLVSRKETDASIYNNDKLFKHVYNMILDQEVISINGIHIPIKAETFCIHGDNPEAAQLVKDLVTRLHNHGIIVE